MAIGTPSESPAIIVTEIDRSGVVPNVQTTTGAFVGNFNWGPVQQATLVSNETSLVEAFGSPDYNKYNRIPQCCILICGILVHYK